MRTLFNHKPIKQAMKERKISYRELSEMTVENDPKGKGVSTATCQRIGAGEYMPNIKSLMLICDSLGISIRRTFMRM